ncbi:MAG: carbon-phosphorus lyase complex subunit PhnI [Deltaproteobacteria bacterium]|jgi:alpha-D-ribose 1-methylphosphonate 5-triphosphate synthase subunit PhnI|nr:carbon-phosphorus lyase complex subunit PhnI [Deltaproteobacteria bacterium]
MYVTVKGGQKAIDAAHRLLDKVRRGDRKLKKISAEQIHSQLGLAVDRVQAEGALYAPELSAAAVGQAMGDLTEAVFLVRAYRTTLRRFGFSEPLETEKLECSRRISAAFKDLPGGQILGPTFDYTHRLLKPYAAETEPDSGDVRLQHYDGHELTPVNNDAAVDVNCQVSSGSPAEPFGAAKEFSSLDESGETASSESAMTLPEAGTQLKETINDIDSILIAEGLMESDQPEGGPLGDLTRAPADFPMDRPMRLQSLARADEGFILSLAYSCLRGYGSGHPFVTSLKIGKAEVSFTVPELDFPVTIGRIELTECRTSNRFFTPKGGQPKFTRGYALCFGRNERKAISMAVVDRALRYKELNEQLKGPAQDEEFVISHSDNVEAAGFVSHLKLPHHVDFQAELELLKHIQKTFQAGPETAEQSASPEAVKSKN